MNPAEVLGVNPRRLPNSAERPSSAPEAVEWLRNPAALVERASLAMQLASEPEWNPTIHPTFTDADECPLRIVGDE